MALVLLLALEHPQLQHLLLGVHLVQDLLRQQHLQKSLLVQDEEMLANQTLPNCKLDLSRLLRGTTELTIYIGSIGS